MTRAAGCEEARLLGKAEIDEDAADKENRNPERQAGGLGLERTGERRDKQYRAADATPRPACPMPGGVPVPAQASRCLDPDLSPPLCYINRAHRVPVNST